MVGLFGLWVACLMGCSVSWLPVVCLFGWLVGLLLC